MAAWLEQDSIEGDNVGRDIGQLQQHTWQGGVEHVQAMPGLPGLRLAGAAQLVEAPEEKG